jgi:hypothetical protein
VTSAIAERLGVATLDDHVPVVRSEQCAAFTLIGKRE